MVTIVEIEQRGIEFDDSRTDPTVDYKANHARFRELVDKHGEVQVSVATGMKPSTIKQHYRDKSGKAMISDYRIKRAEYALQEV